MILGKKVCESREQSRNLLQIFAEKRLYLVKPKAKGLGTLPAILGRVDVRALPFKVDP